MIHDTSRLCVSLADLAESLGQLMQRKFFVAAIISALCMLSGCTRTYLNAPEVSGVVLDAVTQQPITSGVRIYPLGERPEGNSWLGWQAYGPQGKFLVPAVMETVWVLPVPGGRIDRYDRTLLFLHEDYQPYVLDLEREPDLRAPAESAADLEVLLQPKAP